MFLRSGDTYIDLKKVTSFSFSRDINDRGDQTITSVNLVICGYCITLMGFETEGEANKFIAEYGSQLKVRTSSVSSSLAEVTTEGITKQILKSMGV